MNDRARQGAEPAALKLLIDIGPLLVFFVANFLAPVPGPLKIFVATGAFMVGDDRGDAVLADPLPPHLAACCGSPGVMVVVLGGLTIWLHNETFIKMKPTIYYLLVAGLLGFGLATGRPLLKAVLGSAYPGLDERGLAQADPQLGACSSPSWPCSTKPSGATARPISGSASSCGARSPSPSCSPPPTCRCCCATA